MSGDHGLFVHPHGSGDEPVNGVPKARELRRVLPIAQSAPVPDGRLTLTSLELYEDGCILLYFIVAGEERLAEQARREREFEALRRSGDQEAIPRFARQQFSRHLGDDLFFRLQDDLGTHYWCLPRGAGGTPARMADAVGSTPAVPENASRLRITVHHGRYDPDTGEAAPAAPASLLGDTGADPGPPLHTFEVAL